MSGGNNKKNKYLNILAPWFQHYSYLFFDACYRVTRRDNVGWGNKEYYLYNLYNGTRVEK
jgi:hypothetical protein